MKQNRSFIGEWEVCIRKALRVHVIALERNVRNSKKGTQTLKKIWGFIPGRQNMGEGKQKGEIIEKQQSEKLRKKIEAILAFFHRWEQKKFQLYYFFNKKGG